MVNKNILKSVFKRNGEETNNTKIFSEKFSYSQNLNYILNDNETPILITYSDTLSWFLFTDIKIIIKNNDSFQTIFYSDIKSVKPAVLEELRNGIKSPNDFTKLLLQLIDGSSAMIIIEKGLPYQGVYQMLHYIITQNQ